MDPAFLAILVPSLIATGGVLVGYFLLRRTGKESNDTSTFTAVTDQLFALNKLLSDQVAALEQKVTGLELNRVNKDIEAKFQQEKLETVEGELRELRVVNGALSRYLGKLIRLWPKGIVLPLADEPVHWGEV